MKDKYILGINFLHSDSSACLIKNNELIVAIEEERFLRVKHTTAFPLNAIQYCLKYEKIGLTDINIIIHINTFTLALGCNKRYPPNTPAIAPLAPIIGILELGSITA